MTLFLPPLDELQKWPGRNVLAYAVYWGRALAARYEQIHDAKTGRRSPTITARSSCW